MSNISKWGHLDSKIEEVVKLFPEDGYTDLAKKVLPKGTYRDFDLLRTYIRRNFADLRDSLKGNLPDKKEVKVLIYDLETSQIPAKVWWTGKQYVGHKQLKGEAKIITVAWKWLGEDKVNHLTWDMETHSDEKLVEEFIKVYNSADQVVGINNDNFDCRWIRARAAKYSIPINVYVKSLDIQKQAKKLFRLPSYSMDYMSKYFGVSHKLSHEGIVMWDMIEDGNPEQQKEYMKKMIEYNVGDIISTEDLYLCLRKYMKSPVHFGALVGKSKFTCPECGGDNLELIKTTTTTAGTIQRIMRCKDDGVTFKLSNTNYNKFLEEQRLKFLFK